MASEPIIDALGQQTWLDPISNVVQTGIENAYTAAGQGGQQVKNVLSGTWLGHPLHPMITDVPVGSFTASLLFDVLESTGGSQTWAAAADTTLGLGLLGAAGAAISGLNDWHFTVDKQRRIGMAHALLNVSATGLYLTSWLFRRAGSRRWGRRLAYVAYGTMAFAAGVGGDMVFEQHVGTNHATEDAPAEFVAVLDDAALEEGKPQRADANGVPVMVVRSAGHIYALGETCSHLGGPLSEGAIGNGVVTCPWHGSQFELASGRVVNGPTSFAQPCFQTRVRNGKVEVGPRCLDVPARASTTADSTTVPASSQSVGSAS